MEDIKKGMNQIFNTSMITSVVILVLGIFLFIQPDTIIRMISVILGVMILIPGITALIGYFKTKYNPNLITGVITIIMGMILIMNTKLVASIMPFILGIYFIVSGINKLQYALEIKKQNINYKTSLLISILIIICGLLFIINPFGGALVITKVMGIFMVIYSILDIMNVVIIKKEMNDVRNSVSKIIEVEEAEIIEKN